MHIECTVLFTVWNICDRSARAHGGRSSFVCVVSEDWWNFRNITGPDSVGSLFNAANELGPSVHSWGTLLVHVILVGHCHCVCYVARETGFRHVGQVWLDRCYLLSNSDHSPSVVWSCMPSSQHARQLPLSIPLMLWCCAVGWNNEE